MSLNFLNCIAQTVLTQHHSLSLTISRIFAILTHSHKFGSLHGFNSTSNDSNRADNIIFMHDDTDTFLTFKSSSVNQIHY